MNAFFIEMTDTFGGEANYCWVKRFKVSARSEKGAVQKFAKYVGAGWRKTMDSGDFARYDNGGTCIFVEWFDEDKHSTYTVESI